MFSYLNWSNLSWPLSISPYYRGGGRWGQKIHKSKTVHPRKISLTESRGNRSFFMSKSGVRFWFCPLFGKMIAAPPGWSTFREKIFIWANSVIIHSLKNIFKVPGGIRWQFFPVQMRSALRKLRFCKWASPKMQETIKQAGPSI